MNRTRDIRVNIKLFMNHEESSLRLATIDGVLVKKKLYISILFVFVLTSILLAKINQANTKQKV